MSDVRVNEGGIVNVKIITEKGGSFDLPRERIQGFTFEDRSVGVDKLSLTIDNTDLYFFNNIDIVAGNKIEFSFGYPHMLSFKRKARVTSIRGFFRLDVEAYGQESEFHHEKVTKTWKEMALDDIIKAIAKDVGYSKAEVTASSVKRPTTQQAAETAAEFLSRWAARLGCEWYVDVDDKFHFHPRDHAQQPVRTFTWRGAPDRFGIILTPEMEHRPRNKPGAFETVAVDPRKKKVHKKKVAKAEVNSTVLGPSTLVQEIPPLGGKPHKAINLQAWQNEQHVEEAGAARYRVAQQSQLKLKLPVVGDPTLAAKRVIRVEGLGLFLSGNYYIVRATHKIGGGFFTDLELRRDAVGGDKKALKRKEVDQGGARENKEKTPKTKKPLENFLPK